MSSAAVPATTMTETRAEAAAGLATPEGHSDASRRAWEDGHRSQRRDDEDGRRSNGSRQNEGESRSRSRDDDDRRGEGGRSSRSDDNDDRRSSSSGRGHGGWSGDPEGHAEASRRGWENHR